MVAESGRGWKLAPCLVAAVEEANKKAPKRSKRSDGSIGDRAHQSRVSDHNPNSDGWVCALDLTHDPKGGFDAHGYGTDIALRRDPRVKYLISRGRLWNPEIGWRRYTGSNPHNTHLHISCHGTRSALYNTDPWFGTKIAIPTPPKFEIPKNPQIEQQIKEDDEMMTICYQIKSSPSEFWVVSGVWRYQTTKDVFELHKFATANEGRTRHQVISRDDFNKFIVASTNRADHAYLAYHNTNQIAKATGVPGRDIK